MKKILICGMIVLFLTTGCGKVAKLENGKDAVVTLSNGAISVDDLYEEVKNKYALNSLIEMMDTKILKEKYGNDLMEEEKSQIESQISTWLQSFGNEQTLLSQTQSYFGVSTMDGLRNYLSLQYRRNLAVEDYVKENITDKEIQKYYDDEVFGDIKASHILIAPDVTDDMTTAEKTAKEEEALKTAKEVITKLKNGEKFEDLAKEYSNDDTNKDNGGDLGYFSHGKMETSFEEAVLKLENGKYTEEPVKTSYGYHIILRVDQKEKVDLDSIKSEIIENIMNEKMDSDSTLQITGLVELRKSYKMDIQDKELKTQYDNYVENALNEAKENDKKSN